MRVDVGAAERHLKVQVRASGIAGRTHLPHQAALIDALPASNANDAQVGVQSLPAVAVVDDDHIAISPIIPTGINYYTGIRGIDGVARWPAMSMAGWFADGSYSKPEIQCSVVGQTNVLVPTAP
jgi:hypothetical protein